MLADAFAIGTTTLPGTAALDKRTVTLSKQVAAFGENPAVQAGLDRVTLTFSSLRSPLAFLTPVQSSCNYVTLFLRNTAGLLVRAQQRQGRSCASCRSRSTTSRAAREPVAPPVHGPVGNATVRSTSIHIRTPTRPARQPSAQRATSRTRPTSAVIGNPPGKLGLKTETTSEGK